MLYSCINRENSIQANKLFNYKNPLVQGGHAGMELCRTYDSLLATLQEISYGSDHSKAIEAKDLYYQVRTFSFIVILVTFDRILSYTK